MAKDRNGSLPVEDEEEREEKLTRDRHGKSKRKKEESSQGEESESEEEKDIKKKKKRRKKHGISTGSSRRRRRSSGTESDDSDSDSSSHSSGDSESESSYSDSDGSEGEVRRRKKKERRRREREREKERRRRKEKERKRRKEREEKKKKMKEKKKKEKDLGKKGPVTNSWGKYGIIRETDMWNKRPEFTAWLAEVKQVNLESLPNWEEKQMFKEFMEDHNTATFPSKKYYDLDAYHRRMIEKEMRKGLKKAPQIERTVFNDEEQRRQELLIERERQKEEQVEALKCSMQSGMAQAMKEQAQLKEEMAFQYKLGNFEAAAAIQRRLDPDIAM